MRPVWTLALFLNIVSLVSAVRFSGLSFLSVKSGDRVVLLCPFGDYQRTESLVVYKQILGEMPEKVGERLTFTNINIFPKFNSHGYEMRMTDDGITLTIPRIKKHHGGLYYCQKYSMHDVTLSNGTSVEVTDDDEDDVKVSVVQSGVWDSVPAGGSRATLQCSVLSESATAELRVLWFRSAPSQSHPQIIYTHHNNNNNNNTDQCRSSTRTCVYNISVNDTGTYYCAVVLCGRIVFGNGTRVQLENLPKSVGREVIYLPVVVIVCAVVIFAQTFIICKMRNRRLSGARAVDYTEDKTPNQGGDAMEINYVALHFNKKSGKRVARQKEDCVYSKVFPR